MYFIIIAPVTVLVLIFLVWAIVHNGDPGAPIHGALFTLVYILIFLVLIPMSDVGYTESRKVEVKQFSYNEIKNEFDIKFNTNEIATINSYPIITKVMEGQKFLYANIYYNFYGKPTKTLYSLSPWFKIK